MTNLYARLAAIGFSRPFLEKYVIPDWWEDNEAEITGHEINIELLELTFAKRLGLDYRELKSEAPLTPPSLELLYARAAGVERCRAAKIAVNWMEPEKRIDGNPERWNDT